VARRHHDASDASVLTDGVGKDRHWTKLIGKIDAQTIRNEDSRRQLGELSRTIVDRVEKMYRTYGFAAENTISIFREGKVGQEKIARAMNGLREKPLEAFDALGIRTLSDFKRGEVLNFATGEKDSLDFPESNVLLYQLDGHDFMCVRPSGTEPKIKVYFGCYGNDRDDVEARQKEYEQIVLDRVNVLLEE
jgi:phosphoglucomutase